MVTHAHERSPYATTKPVFLNPTGYGSFSACETKWATHSCLGVDKRRGPTADVRDRGAAAHLFVCEYVKRYALTGKLDAFEGLAGKNEARDIFEQLDEDDGICFDESTSREILAAVRAQLPKLHLEAFEVVALDGAPLVECTVRHTLPIVGFEAIVDCVLRHKTTGEIWLIDWKTTAAAIDKTKTLNFVEHNMQLVLQRLVLRANGIDVDRSTLCQVRSIASQPPPLTAKTKKVVRSMSALACDGETFRQALEDNGESIGEKELAKIQKLDNCFMFVRWLPDITNAAAEDALVHELHSVRERMVEIVSGRRLPLLNVLNVNGHAPYVSGCKRCDYSKWCRAALRNGGTPDLSLVGVDYMANDKATFERVKSVTPRDASEAYVEYAKAYGLELQALETFTP